MNISGLNKAEVLAALYNGSRQQGMGFMDKRGAQDMTVEQAQKEIEGNSSMYFDYLHGRVMKIGLRTDDLRTAAYNRDNGEGAAERIIEDLRSNVQIEARPAFARSRSNAGLGVLKIKLGA